MSLADGVRGRPGAAVVRINPVAKLAAAFAVSVPLILTIDVVSAGVALLLEAVLFVWAGLGASEFFRRTAPIWLAAPLAGLTTLLYGRASGETYLQFLVVHISDGSIGLAMATTLRVLAIGLPAVVLLATVDPTDLADGLAQTWRLPARFVLGGLAGLRLLSLFFDDWRALGLARRARGVADRHAIRRFLGQAFSLLVLALRRGSKLATAMEARGFGSEGERTWAREARFGAPEWIVIAIGCAVAVIATAAALVAGTWTFIAS